MIKSIILLILISFNGIKTFTLNCNYKSATYGFGLGSLYQCTATSINPSSNHTITEVSGTHLSGKNDLDVQVVYIYGNDTLPFVPRGLIQFFPNIIVYGMYQTQINNLIGDELYEFGEQLQWFRIWPGNLTEIPSSLFNARPKLVYIDFTSNKIERVGYDIFTPLNKTLLKEVDFRNNRCIHRLASSQTAIRDLIDDLRNSCPFNELTSTTVSTSTTSFITTTTSRPEGTCFEESINDFVCDLENAFDDVKIELSNTKDELNQTNVIVSELEKSLALMNEELETANLKVDSLERELNQTKIIITNQEIQLNVTMAIINEMQDEQMKLNEKLEETINELILSKEIVMAMQEELPLKDQIIERLGETTNDQEARMEWLEFEVLRLTTNPCFC